MIEKQYELFIKRWSRKIRKKEFVNSLKNLIGKDFSELIFEKINLGGYVYSLQRDLVKKIYWKKGLCMDNIVYNVKNEAKHLLKEIEWNIYLNNNQNSKTAKKLYKLIMEVVY